MFLSDIRNAALQAAAVAAAFHYKPVASFPSFSGSRLDFAVPSRPMLKSLSIKSTFSGHASSSSDKDNSLKTFNNDQAVNVYEKPSSCTADELHYVPVKGTEWKIALWRYLPSPEAPKRNHPLMLLSGVGTNAIGYDLSPGASFARHMSSQGFDTWIVEFRGAGLSMRTTDSKASNPPTNSPIDPDLNSIINDTVALSERQSDVNGTPESYTKSTITNGEKKEVASLDESQLVAKLTATFLSLSERLSGYLNEAQLKAISAKFFDRISKLLEDARLSERFNEIRANMTGLLETRQNSVIAGQIRELSQRLINIIEEGHRSVSPQIFNLQDRLSATIEDFQKQLDLIVLYDWDFDNYLEEDVPSAMEYIKHHSKVSDGKLFAIGHSMGGILLYAMLSRSSFEGGESGLAAVVTLASSVDYMSSKSSLKTILPLADPAQALNVPVVPLGALLAAAYPLASRPPYVLSWLSPVVSARDMMHPELFEKLVLNNFCTVPAKVLLQLATALRNGGLRNRDGTLCYKDHLHKCDVPVFAMAADQDLICPPEAVYDTVKLFPEHLYTYKILGKPDGQHYGHYDLVGGLTAVDEVYPCIVEFLSKHDEPNSE